MLDFMQMKRSIRSVITREVAAAALLVLDVTTENSFWNRNDENLYEKFTYANKRPQIYILEIPCNNWTIYYSTPTTDRCLQQTRKKPDLKFMSDANSQMADAAAMIILQNIYPMPVLP